MIKKKNILFVISIILVVLILFLFCKKIRTSENRVKSRVLQYIKFIDSKNYDKAWGMLTKQTKSLPIFEMKSFKDFMDVRDYQKIVKIDFESIEIVKIEGIKIAKVALRVTVEIINEKHENVNDERVSYNALIFDKCDWFVSLAHY